MGEANQRKNAMDVLFEQAPRYKCHKIVKALQITAFFEGPGILDFGPHLPKAKPPSQLFARYKPKPGDYLVFYEDGYVSLSPQLAFENGYTRIEQTHTELVYDEEGRPVGTRKIEAAAKAMTPATSPPADQSESETRTGSAKAPEPRPDEGAERLPPV